MGKHNFVTKLTIELSIMPKNAVNKENCPEKSKKNPIKLIGSNYNVMILHIDLV